MSTIDLIQISVEAFHQKPQRGERLSPSWGELAGMLATPMRAGAKDAAGGIALGFYADNIRRKANLLSVGALVVDIDGGTDVATVAEVMVATRSIVLETFSSTPDQPRCRLFAKLAEDVDGKTYEAAHAILRAKLRRIGAKVDEGAKDPCRLSYLPVRRPGAPYAFACTEGAELDAKRMIAAQPLKPQRPIERRPVTHGDAYIRAALNRAAAAIAGASDGARHETLNREAFALARLNLSETEIASALLPVAVQVMGEGRRREAERTIRDAVAARRRAA